MTIHQMINLSTTAVPQGSPGLALYAAATNHFVHFHGFRNLGFGYEACNAAVAVQKRADLTSYPNFSVCFGSSRLHTGLDPVFNTVSDDINPRSPFASSQREQHAEQTAILIACDQYALWTDQNGRCHIYVDYSPCENCEPWLENRMEDWVVYYRAALNLSSSMVKERKDTHKQQFGQFFGTKFK
ncbi:hypothetical protein F1643_13125 [Azospirillum sp. INR13]|uniref:hypothetical protein n=1 Tax=Azospirillum sp. INR13 TaxID=2596919 RepID=UPI0018924C60|nr:hypothetical protein [Azospirillum sp. INR13]MBF5095266.1 hypothetical protein [Azospirillum sp. INR13]